MPSPRERFAQTVTASDTRIDLDSAALWIAAEEYPDLDVEHYLSKLDALAASAAESIGGADSTGDRVAGLNHFLFVEQGFSGNRGDYYDPRNSYLNEVLDRRTGIPITLSLVYMAVAGRLGLDVDGIGFPGHFLTRVVAEEVWIVDPFLGIVLSENDCQLRFQAIAGQGQLLRPEVHLRSATSREILIRLLSNLKQLFLSRADTDRALACMDRILILDPDKASELRDRALLFEHLRYDAAAAADLERFLELEPDGDSSTELRQRLMALRTRLRVH